MQHDILSLVPLFTHFTLAISVHEFAHAYAAYRLGDSTARDHGRLTLNPLAHLDPLGTLFLLFGWFGWGKPVPVSHRNLRNPRRDSLWISAAGPCANLVLAVCFACVLWAWHRGWYPELIGREGAWRVWRFLGMGILLNVSLATFNLLPVFPLDGEKVLLGLIPGRWVGKAIRFRSYGVGVLLVLLLGGPVLGLPLLAWLFDWVVYPVFRFLMPRGI